MNTKHTEGPMEVRGSRKTALYIGGRYIADTDSGKPHEMPEHIRAMDQANAERLALAWNLLPDMATELLSCSIQLEAARMCIVALLEGCADRRAVDLVRDACLHHAEAGFKLHAKATKPNAGVTQAFPKGRF